MSLTSHGDCDKCIPCMVNMQHQDGDVRSKISDHMAIIMRYWTSYAAGECDYVFTDIYFIIWCHRLHYCTWQWQTCFMYGSHATCRMGLPGARTSDYTAEDSMAAKQMHIWHYHGLSQGSVTYDCDKCISRPVTMPHTGWGLDSKDICLHCNYGKAVWVLKEFMPDDTAV